MDLTSPAPDRPWRLAAILVAVVGLIELLLFGCCTAGLVLTEPSLTELRQSPMTLPPGMTHDQLLAVARTVQTAMAMAAVVLFVLPGLALLGLSPLVDRGSRPAITAAKVILWVQAVLAACLLLLNLLASALMLSLLNLLMALVLLGSLLAGQVWAILSLGRVDGGRRDDYSPDNDDFEPWNSHLA